MKRINILRQMLENLKQRQSSARRRNIWDRKNYSEGGNAAAYRIIYELTNAKDRTWERVLDRGEE